MKERFYPLDENNIGVNDWHDERFWAPIVNPGYYKLECPAKEKIGVSIIIVPGGAYAKLNPIYNGIQYAKWFNAYGIDAYVLIHSLPEGKGLKRAGDDLRAMVHVASKDSDGGLVGIMGCSAGGHLCALFSNGNNEIVDFVVLVSPVISMRDERIKTEAHHRTKENLGLDYANTLMYSAEHMVRPECPPTLIIHSQRDIKVDAEQSTLYFNRLNAEGVKCALHIYTGGQHDFKVFGNEDTIETSDWMRVIQNWIWQHIKK